MTKIDLMPPDVKAVPRWLQRDFVMECANILESLSISLREAAYRGSDETMFATLKQMRLTLVEAISVGKEMQVGSEKIPPTRTEEAA